VPSFNQIKSVQEKPGVWYSQGMFASGQVQQKRIGRTGSPGERDASVVAGSPSKMLQLH